MTTIADRIIEIVNSKQMSMSEFARVLNVTPAYISKLNKNSDAVPSDRLIMTIVKEFGVDEHWLRTGEGEMFPPKSEYDQLAELVNKMLRNKDDKERLFITEFLYNHMSDDEVHYIMDKMIEFVDGIKEKMDPHD